MVGDYRPTRSSGLCMLSDAQRLHGTATSHSFPPLLHALPFCFVTSDSLQPLSLCVCSPWGVPLSFCISLSPSVSLHPVSARLLPPPAPFVVHSILCIHCCCCSLFQMCVCVCFSVFPLQWSYGFYLTHNQGQSGFEFFFKTKELKKKWLEQFGMAMWVCATVCVLLRDGVCVSVSCILSHSIKTWTHKHLFFRSDHMIYDTTARWCKDKQKDEHGLERLVWGAKISSPASFVFHTQKTRMSTFDYRIRCVDVKWMNWI